MVTITQATYITQGLPWVVRCSHLQACADVNRLSLFRTIKESLRQRRSEDYPALVSAHKQKGGADTTFSIAAPPVHGEMGEKRLIAIRQAWSFTMTLKREKDERDCFTQHVLFAFSTFRSFLCTSLLQNGFFHAYAGFLCKQFNSAPNLAVSSSLAAQLTTA